MWNPFCLKGWWKRGDVETKLNTVNMTAWVHRECNSIEEEAITKLQEAWDSSEQKDECTVRLNDLEGAYWRGTEIGQLGGYGFQGVTLGVDGGGTGGVVSARRAVPREILAAKTGWNWIGHSEQRIPGHRIQTNARHEKQLCRRGDESSPKAVQ